MKNKIICSDEIHIDIWNRAVVETKQVTFRCVDDYGIFHMKDFDKLTDKLMK